MGADWTPEKAPKPQQTPADEATRFIAVVLIIAIGVGAFIAVMWMLNAMVDAKAIH